MGNSDILKKYTQNLSILYIDDCSDLRHDMVEILKNFFNTVDSCSNGIEALSMYRDFKNKNKTFYDIVLSDIHMPKMNGVDLTKEIYNLNQDQAIIIISAYDKVDYLLSLINLGIEQFIKKPIDYQELLKSLLDVSKKITSQSKSVKNSSLVYLSDKVVYDMDSKSLQNEDKNIYITKYEIIFIELLISNIGKIYSNEEIVKYYTRKKEKIDSTNIRKLVSKLRKKLPENYLKSIYGVGYKFIPYYKD
jgi:DNA-binding response OmpR family regulator